MAVFFIRHGLSAYNVASEEWKATHSREEQKTIRYDPAFLDPELTSLGIDQATQARTQVQALRPDLVLVSPLRRALHTCELLFQGESVPIRVCPLFTERCCHAPDLSSFFDQPFEEYAHFDWTEMMGKEGYWMLEEVKTIATDTVRMKARSKVEAQTLLLEEIRRNYPRYIENDECITERIGRIREYLRREVSQGKKVAVVTHCFLIRELLTELQGSGRLLSNCEVLALNPALL